MKCRGRGLFLVFLLVLFFNSGLSAETGEFEVDQFISPDVCGDCHTDIYSQWENSMHNLSHRDPVYEAVSAFLLKGLSDKDEIAEAESCVKCHTPVGFVTGNPKKRSDDLNKVPDIAKQGIQCDYCHSAVSVEKMYNNGLQLSPGHGEDDPGIKRGPFDDSESDFHDSEFSELHTKADICGTCHDVKHVVFKTDLETTYQEWKKGPYNSRNPKKRITCQGCHMYQRPGVPATGSTERPANPGYASDDGPERDHIFTHYFVGGNGFIPGNFKDKEKTIMAEQRLKNAASISIDSKKIRKGKLKIKVTNSGAGHYLPTGLTDFRQMWLEVTVKDGKGKELYASGKLDKNGYVPEDAVIYNTIFGDGKGNPVVNISKAREVIKDKRIKPLKTVKETFKLPKGLKGDLIVKVRLLYRSAPQKLLDMVLGKGTISFPVITMTEAETKI